MIVYINAILYYFWKNKSISRYLVVIVVVLVVVVYTATGLRPV